MTGLDLLVNQIFGDLYRWARGSKELQKSWWEAVLVPARMAYIGDAEVGGFELSVGSKADRIRGVMRIWKEPDLSTTVGLIRSECCGRLYCGKNRWRAVAQ